MQPDLWQESLYRYESKCLESNETLLVHPSRSHTVTVWICPAKVQAVSQLLLPHNRSENTRYWEMAKQKGDNSHILSLPPSCPCIHHQAGKWNKVKEDEEQNEETHCLTIWKTQWQNTFYFLCSIKKVLANSVLFKLLCVCVGGGGGGGLSSPYSKKHAGQV